MSVFILFYAFGFTNDKVILDFCSFQDPEVLKLVS
jgi:hypothetical protein